SAACCARHAARSPCQEPCCPRLAVAKTQQKREKTAKRRSRDQVRWRCTAAVYLEYQTARGIQRWEEGEMNLARESQELGVQLHEIGVEAVIAGAPFANGFAGVDSQDRKVCRLAGLAHAGKLLPDVGDPVRRHEILAVL